MTQRRLFLRAVAGILCFCMVLLAVLACPAQAAGQVVRVGWFEQDGYQELDAAGEPYGYNYEYLMRVAQYTGWEYEFVRAQSFADCYQLLCEGEIDILAFVLQTEERREQVAFSQFNIGSVSNSLFVRADSPVAPYDFAAFNGLRVACIESQNIQLLQNYAAQNGFSVQPVLYTSSPQVEQAVRSGEVDAGLMGGYQGSADMRVVANFAPGNAYFAVNKNNPQLLAQLDSALEEIALASPYYARDLAHQYLSKTKEALYLTEAEQKFIAENPEQEVYYYRSWFPLSYTDANGNFCGVAADVFARIAEMTGLRFTYYPIDGEQTAEAGILAAEVHDYSVAYRDGYYLTAGYLNVPMMSVQRADQTKPPKVTAVSQALGATIAASRLPGQQLLVADTVEDALQAVADGRADAAWVNAFAGEQLLRQNSKLRTLHGTLLSGEGFELGAAVLNDRPQELRSILNKVLPLISQSDINSMIYRNTAGMASINLATIVSQMPPDVILFLSLTLLIIILLLVVILVRQLHYSSRIREIVNTDELTKVLSQRGFMEQATLALTKLPAQREGGKYGYLIDFDINNFGSYNAINGYVKGNELLCTIAGISRSLCESGELCARIQADHFLLLYNCYGDDLVQQRLRHMLDLFRRMTDSPSLLVSFGIYEIVDAQMSITDICDRALTAKRSIKGSYDRFITFYDEEYHKRQLSNVELLGSFEDALVSGEFIHYLQPKFDMNSGRVVGAEALVRWQYHSGTLIMPGQFIELLEDNGLIAKLDIYMTEQACANMVAMRERGLQLVPVSLNFSRVHLYDVALAAKLSAVLRRYDLPPHLFEVEITETVFVDHQQLLIDTIDRLHAAGFIVSIDDFGSGYSSLNLLKDVSVDVIKLDRGFLSSVDESRRGAKVIEKILALAREIGLITVAEGIETAEQDRMLREYGCDIGQGYYYSVPLPQKEFEQLLECNQSVAQPSKE